MNKKRIRFLSILLLMISIVSVPVGAISYSQSETIPYNSYTYWNNYSGTSKTAVYNKPIYNVAFSMDYMAMGLEQPFKKITDICTDSNQKIYILDGGNSQVVILDKNYNYITSFIGVANSDQNLQFTNASGIFVDDEGIIYIADTENSRVLSMDAAGSLVKIYELPESNLIPESFKYRPIKIAVDSRGYMYVLSDGSYNGAILYSPDDQFLGFYGANIVKKTAGQVLSGIFDRIFMNNEKRKASDTVLPFQFTDLCIDQNNFVFTTTGNTNTTTQSGQIRKLSPGGKNVLNSDNLNFADNYTTTFKQDLHSIAVDNNGYIYVLDSAYGHIFIYDQFGNLLGVFGNGTRKGIQKGSFTYAQALTLNDQDIIVADSTLNTLTVFQMTNYGSLLKTAQQLTNDGHYGKAKAYWQDIYDQDKNNQLAYIGLAKAYYDSGEYKLAMQYAKKGYDRDTYALAFEYIRNQYLKSHFTLVLVVAVLVILAVVALNIFIKKKKKRIPYRARLLLRVPFHPRDVFSEIKEKKNGSALYASVVLFLFFITTVMKSTNGGFCFTYFESNSYNALFVLLRTVGLILLFTLCFWGVSSLFGGLGKISEIYTVSCYCLQPIIVGNIAYIILTNVMVPSEIAFLDLLTNAIIIYTVFLLCIALITICDYEFGKLLLVTLLSVIGMIIVIFVGVVIILLLQLLIGFFRTIFAEIYKIMIVGG